MEAINYNIVTHLETAIQRRRIPNLTIISYPHADIQRQIELISQCNYPTRQGLLLTMPNGKLTVDVDCPNCTITELTRGFGITRTSTTIDLADPNSLQHIIHHITTALCELS